MRPCNTHMSGLGVAEQLFTEGTRRFTGPVVLLMYSYFEETDKMIWICLY